MHNWTNSGRIKRSEAKKVHPQLRKARNADAGLNKCWKDQKNGVKRIVSCDKCDPEKSRFAGKDRIIIGEKDTWV